MNGAFALYRYPYANEYTLMKQTSGEPLTLSSCKELNGKSGFIFAPFRHTFGLPFLLLSPNIVEKHVVDELVDFDEVLFHKRDIDGERHKYEKVFSCFHDKLEIGEFSKIVLSRCSDEEAVSPLDIEKLFMRACVLYPRMFIALVSMPQCGTWLMATPEILLENNKDTWHTMALAGTMPIDEYKDSDMQLAERKDAGDIHEWSTKNIREQEYVSMYIKECLYGYSSAINETGPYTARAGLVKHLRSDFYFKINVMDIGKLIEKLHPTPAVCGIPKSDAYNFICENEAYDRKYYSGFAGPLNMGEEGTHLYVTLRCMQINNCKCRLYAGGGLLADSEVYDEWLETEAKMDTMRRCLSIKRM